MSAGRERSGYQCSSGEASQGGRDVEDGNQLSALQQDISVGQEQERFSHRHANDQQQA